MPQGPPECSVPVWTLPTLVVLVIVCMALLVTTLALGVVGPTRILLVLNPLTILRGTAAFPRETPIRPPPVLLTFPWTVLGILLVPLRLKFMTLPLLFIIMSEENPTTCLFPMAPSMWPTVIMALTNLLPSLLSSVKAHLLSLPESEVVSMGVPG